MSNIDILESKNETKTSFYYLKDKINELFKNYPNIFDSDLKNFFKDIASEEDKNINYNLLLKEIFLSSKDTFSFFDRYGDLYEFCFALFEENIYADDIKLEQIKFLKDLMNGYKVHKRFERFERANAKRTVHDIFLKNTTDKYNRKIYLQAKILFGLRENFLKKLLHKWIIKNNLNQSDIKYEKSIAERTKLKRQRLNKIKEKEQNINNELFKHYFKYLSPSNMYNTLSDVKNTERHDI